MDAPEPQHGRNAERVRALVQAVLQKGGRRRLLLLALFAVLVVTASRGGTRPAASAPPVAPPVRVEHPPTTTPGLPIASLPYQSPETVALDNLLSRYDILIRLLEAHAIESTGESTPALAELRTMRASLYEASRRAIHSTATRSTAPD